MIRRVILARDWNATADWVVLGLGLGGISVLGELAK